VKVSVIIPQYKHMDLLHQILFGLWKYCKEDIDEIIIVDDFSNDPDLDNYYVNGMMINKLPVTVLKKETNEGFLKTCNRGVQEATGDIVVLLSNDVLIKDNFIKQAKTEIFAHSIGTIVGNRLLTFDTGWNKFGEKIFPYLEGWLLICTKDAWNDIGGFDERFGSSDYEDVDFSTMAVAKGYNLMSLDNSKITHIGGQSYGFNPNREVRTKENKIKFREKWIK